MKISEYIKQHDLKCEACEEYRPYELISVSKHTIMEETNIICTRNVKYCNDREECKNKADLIGKEFVENIE